MRRILVVDDDEGIAKFLANRLAEEGFSTETAGDGVEAVLKVADNQWDALLMDIRMPKLDGLNALRIIRRLKPDLRVVMFSGAANNNEMIMSTRLGADICMLKPINLEALVNTLKDFFKQP